MVIKLIGEYGEGGGSIVRVALALSTLTGKAFEVTNIRKGRAKSGLKAQHLYCIKGAQQLCNAKVKGMELGSEYLKFEPSTLKTKNLYLDIGTAGSMTLILQSILLPSMFGNKKINIKLIGGSDCSWSPPFDYFKEVFLPQIQRYAQIECRLIKRGYYPKGGGIVELKINPIYKLSNFKNFKEFYSYLKENAPKINLTERGNLIKINGVSHASKQLEKAKVAERQANSAELILKQLNCPVNIRREYSDSLSPGSVITLYAIFSKLKDDVDINKPVIIGADSLGERGKRAENVGVEAAQKLIKEINAGSAADEYLADNLIPIMAFIPPSKIKTSKISNHTLTNIYVCKQFLGDIFKVNEKEKIIETYVT
jgi:RNA 3'-phosphate cyclase